MKTAKAISILRRRPWAMVAVLMIALSFTACQKNREKLGGDIDDDIIGEDPGGYVPPADTGGGGGPSTIGSGSGGGVTDADKQALNAALQQNETIAPTDPDAGLSAALAEEARRLIAEEKAGKDVAVQKMLLAGKMLEECSKKIARFAPIPGQPLLGSWNGGGACAVKFEIAGTGAGGRYVVDGGTKGQMQADLQGKGAIKAEPFSGNVIDSPQSGNGTLTHPTFFKSKSGTSPCNVAVKLDTPKSPIPPNYQEAMKQAGKCFRQTLVLMSPAFDKLFRDPATSGIMAQFLGVGGGQPPR